jgi:hypothetical protein
MSNSCYNPFIYLLCNEKFKKELRFKLSCCFGQRGPRLSVDYTNTVIWRNGRSATNTTYQRQGKVSMVASDLEIPRSPSCGPNNNLCLDTKQYSSPSPSYLSLHQTTSEECSRNNPNQNPVNSGNSKGIIPIVSENDKAKEKDNFKKNNKIEKVAADDRYNKLENVNCDL